MKKEVRQIVLEKYNGKCAYCGVELTKGWHVDHIEPIVRNWTNGTCEKPENHNLDNFNPSCASCNIQKNSLTLEQFRDKIKQFINSLNSYSNQYKFAKKYNLVSETNIEVVFHFEQLPALASEARSEIG
jgi:5-methylcytosine-specific restriction endonuclease McrA